MLKRFGLLAVIVVGFIIDLALIIYTETLPKKKKKISAVVP